MAPSADTLLAWYDRHHRDLPWRYKTGEKTDPYRVWLSEVMLQQTTVATVIPYFQTFVTRWPTVRSLAAASLDDVLGAWAGLGYYARARHLHACAQNIATLFQGQFPSFEKDLLQLPGVGPYTAAAIASIAFGRKATAVDGNVKRVICRVFGIDQPLSLADKKIQECAQALTPDYRNGDYTQALMELGALICTPRQPQCSICPWQSACIAYRTGQVDKIPIKIPKKKNPSRYGLAFWLVDKDGSVWLRRRPEQGLLGGMLEIPSSPWIGRRISHRQLLKEPPVLASWKVLPGSIEHVFSHFPLELQVACAHLPASMDRPDGLWIHPSDIEGRALPTVMKKVVRHVFAHTS